MSNIVQNLLFRSGANVISRIITILNIIYVARVVGPEGFGIISFVMAFVNFFINDAGIKILGIREVAKKKERTEELVGRILPLRLAIISVIYLILIGITIILPFDGLKKGLIIISGLILFANAFSLDWAFNGLERLGLIGIGGIIASVANLLIVLLFVKDAGDIYFVALANVIGLSLGSLFLFLFYNREFSFKMRIKDLAYSKDILRESLPIGLSLFLETVYTKTDSLLVGLLCGDQELGYYNAANNLKLGVSEFIGIFIYTLFPSISVHYNNSSNKLKELLHKTLLLSILFAVIGGIFFTVFAKPIVLLLFGKDYLKSVVIAVILMWSAMLILIRGIFTESLIACNQQGLYLKTISISGAFFVISLFILISIYGVIGAALASILAEVFMMILVFYIFNKRIMGIESREILLMGKNIFGTLWKKS